jgi:beta-glucosidase
MTLRVDGPLKACLVPAEKAILLQCLTESKTNSARMRRSRLLQDLRLRACTRFMDMFSGRKPAPPPTPEEIADWIAKAKAAAEDADVVVAVMGEVASMNGEAASRATLDLPGIQEQMLEAVAATGKPVTLVLEGGRPLDIRWASEHLPAILEAWYPGTEGGNAVADVLFGDVNPGGKLPVSWPRTAGSEPLYYNHTITHEPEDAPRFTSRYWDINSKPLYPFGYGLSYTTFKFANMQLSKTSMGIGETTEVSVDVTNTGSVAGRCRRADLYPSALRLSIAPGPTT